MMRQWAHAATSSAFDDIATVRPLAREVRESSTVFITDMVMSVDYRVFETTVSLSRPRRP